jgi:hypothetical protein
MSSVLPLTASYIVASTERVLLSVGRTANQDGGGTTFAAQLANAAQGPERVAPAPADSVVVIIDRLNDLTPVATTRPLSDPLAAAAGAGISAADSVPLASPAVDAAAAAFVAPLAGDAMVAPSEAAYAYAQMMQVWLENRAPRQVTARPAQKSKPREQR